MINNDTLLVQYKELLNNSNTMYGILLQRCNELCEENIKLKSENSKLYSELNDVKRRYSEKVEAEDMVGW